MSLYQEILFLKYRYRGSWCVENVIPYYDPLVTPTVNIDRHLYWSNFDISQPEFKRFKKFNVANARSTTRISAADDYATLQKHHGIYLPEGTKNQRKLLRNAVHPELGLHILNELVAASPSHK